MADGRALFSDGDLLRLFLERQDPDAFEAIVRRHGPAVLAVCRQVLGNESDAEDAFQATFLVLLHKAGSLANPEVVGSWLQGTAYFAARNARLSIRRRQMHEEKYRLRAPTSTCEPRTSQSDIEPLLEELARLPEWLRAPLSLCDLEGKPRAQAARLLKCRPGTLSSRLARGRALLRVRLQRRGYPACIGLLAEASARSVLRASLPSGLVARTMDTVTASLIGDAAAGTAATSKSTVLAKSILTAWAARKIQTCVMWAIGLAMLGGTGLMVRGNLVPGFAAPRSTATAQAQERNQQEITPDNQDAESLPAGAIARLGSLRMRPGDEVTALAFSPDGTKLASGPIYSNVVQIWDRASGRLLVSCKGHAGTLMQIQFTRDGNFVVSSSLDKTVRIWDASTGRERTRLATPWPGSFCVSPDGRVLAMSNQDKSIYLCDVATGKAIRALKVGIEASIRPGFEPIALAFSADGKRLVTADFESLRIWEVATGRLERSVETNSWGQARAAAFNGDSVAVISSAYGAPYTLWLQSPQSEPRILRVEQAKLAQCTFSPDGRSVLFSSPETGLRLWDANSGKEIRQFSGMQGNARALAFSADGKIVAAGTDASVIQQWDAATGRKIEKQPGQAAAVDGAAISPAGNIAVTRNADGTVDAWDVSTDRKLWRWQGTRSISSGGIHFTPDGSKIIAGGLNKEIQILDAASGKLLAKITTKEPVKVVAISADGQSVLSTPNNQTAIWRDLATGRELAEYPKPGNSPAMSLIASYIATGQRVHAPCCAASGDGRVVALGNQTKLTCIREDNSGAAKILFERELNSISCLALSADGSNLAVAGDDPFVLMLDAVSGKAVKQLETDGRDLTALAYSPDGKILAAGTNRGTLLLWDTSSGKRLASRTGHRGAIRQIAFTADGKHLITAGGADATAIVWDVAAFSVH